MNRFRLIAHRGIHDNSITPENSLKAFQKAIDYNIAIELDVRITKDNQLVVFHDDNLLRMAKKELLIEESTLKELNKIKLLETEEKIPTLKEVLKLVNNKVLLDIEIKNTKKLVEVSNALQMELKNYHNFVIKSFNPNIIKKLRNKYPNWIYGLLITPQNRKIYNYLILKMFKPDFIAINKQIVNSKYIQKYSINHQIFVWTINSKEEIEIINNPNYQYICNNLPYIKSID